MADLSNQIPFNPTRPASAMMYVGRSALKHQLTSGLRSGMCFELIGSPGIGKTSLLMAVQRELVSSTKDQEQGLISLPTYGDFSREDVSIDAILLLIIKNVVESLQIQRRLNCPLDVLNQANDECRKGRLQTALEVILNWAYLREKRAHQVILLLDNLHRITDTPLFF